MINKRIMAELSYAKDKHFKDNNFKLVLVAAMYFTFFGIIGAYALFRVFYYFDSNKVINEFNSKSNPTIQGLFWKVENISKFVPNEYNLNIGVFKAIKDISYEETNAFEITLDNNESIIVNFENKKAKDNMISTLVHYVESNVPNKKINFIR